MTAKLNVLSCHILNYCLLTTSCIRPTSQPCPTYPPLLLSAHSSISLPISLLTYPPLSPSSHPPICPSIHLYVCLSTYISYPPLSTPTHLPLYPIFYPFLKPHLFLPPFFLNITSICFILCPNESKGRLVPKSVSPLLPSISLLLTFACPQEFRNGYCKMPFSRAPKAVVPVSISAGDCL